MKNIVLPYSCRVCGKKVMMWEHDCKPLVFPNSYMKIVIKLIPISILFMSFVALADKPPMHPTIKDTPECEKCLKVYSACAMRAINYAPLDAIEEEITECRFVREECLRKNECRNKE